MRDSIFNHIEREKGISRLSKTRAELVLAPKCSSPITPDFPYSFLTAPTSLISLFPIDLLPSLPSAPLHLLKNSNAHPNKPHDRRHDAVPNGPFGGIIAELEPQAAVDYPQGDDYPAHPDVCMRPNGTGMIFLEVSVVS